MGLLSNLLFFPVTGPVAGIRWTLGQVQTVVEQELTDDTPIKQELMELQMQLALGDVLGMDALPTEPTQVPNAGDTVHLDALQLDAAAHRTRFLERWRDALVTIVDRGTYLDRTDIEPLIDATFPGADEIFALLY